MAILRGGRRKRFNGRHMGPQTAPVRVALGGHLANAPHEILNVEADDGRYVEEFDEVYSALAALDVRDERLMPAKGTSHLCLRQSIRAAARRNRVGDQPVTCGVDRLRHQPVDQ